MGAADFPLPRHELPAIKTTPREHQEAKELVEHMLAHTVLEFEKFVYRDQNHVDPRIWKSFGSRDRLKVYKQREGGLMHAVRTQRLDSMSELPSESILAAMQPGSLMMSGYWPGKVENAMYAVVTKSQEELALVVIYLHEDVADCALLNVMEAPTEEEPYRFLGYKYFVRKSPTNAHIVRNRDSLYLEYCGMTKTSKGEQIGFHIMHSVDLPGFPDLKSRNSVRAVQSVRYIYRQKSENIVEIFMLGNMDISGHLGGLKSISSFFTADTLFGIARLVDCAEAKRLTDMVRARQQHIGLLQAKEKGVDCSICRQRKSLFKSATLTECTTCGQYVCARCWLYKKVFVPDAEVILGKFHKVCVCKTCVLAANAGYYEEPRIHVSLSRHGDRKTSRHRADSSTITGSYASDSGSEYSSSNGRSGSVYSSESSHSNGTQQAHYRTQFHSTPHSDRGGFHHRMRRTASRENRACPLEPRQHDDGGAPVVTSAAAFIRQPVGLVVRDLVAVFHAANAHSAPRRRPSLELRESAVRRQQLPDDNALELWRLGLLICAVGSPEHVDDVGQFGSLHAHDGAAPRGRVDVQYDKGERRVHGTEPALLNDK
ncbi:hypothetical protein FI667_g8823, partial [Globisporangium splendens]